MKEATLSEGRIRQVSSVLLIACGILVVVVLAIVLAARLTGTKEVWTPAGPAVAQRDIRFEDRPEGGVVVIDATTAATIADIKPGDGGFLRVVLRGLARDRRRVGVGSGPAFRLTRWSDKALSLEDLATGKRIYLNAFGFENADTFAKFLGPEARR